MTTTPHKLLDAVLLATGIKNDTRLAIKLEISPSAISVVRHKKKPVGETLILRLHKLSKISVKKLEKLTKES